MEPKEPATTCQNIDNIIRCVEYIKQCSGSIRVMSTDIFNGTSDMVREMEDLRSLNETLREWGQHWKDKYEELEREKNND